MGLTRVRAEQISNIDYKQAVRVITLTNITLTGGAPSQVDGVTLSPKDRILVAGQSTASENGLYDVVALGTGSTGTWVRTSDANATGEIEAGMIVMVTEGLVYADISWKLITNNPIVIGTTDLVFAQNTGDSFGVINANSTAVLANSVTSTVTFTNGNNLVISANATSDTITFAVADAPTFTGNLTASNANIIGTTASTSKTTGALKVAGGVGVAGDIYAGNSVVVDGGTYGNVTTTQFASVFGSGGGPNPYSIMQVRSSDGVSGLGMQAYTGSGTLYGNTAITFALGQIRDKDVPSSLTTKAYIDSTGLNVTGIVSATGNVTGNYILGNGSQLTGLASGNSISNGNSNVVVANNGNVTVTIDGAGPVGKFSPGEFTVFGIYSNPNTIDDNVVIQANTNSMMVGPVSVNPANNIYVPDGSAMKFL